MQYLIINNSKDRPRSYAEQYRLFDEREDAIEHLREIGGDPNPFGMGLSDRPGVASIEISGDLDILFLPILTQ